LAILNISLITHVLRIERKQVLPELAGRNIIYAKAHEAAYAYPWNSKYLR
jgi:hypothetical protein